MPGNTNTSVQSNQTFATTPVPIVVGVLNPANSPQTVWDCGVGMSNVAATTIVTGSPASFTILVEGTYDGSNWSTVATLTNVAGETQFGTGLVPFTNLRARCTAVSGGTSPTVNVMVTASQEPFVNTGGGTSPAQTVNQGSANLGITLGWPVAQGAINPIKSLNAATTTVTGTVADFQSAKNGATFACVASAGTTAGAITLFGSVDAATFAPLTGAAIVGQTTGATLSNGVLTFTAPCTVLVSLGNNGSALRAFRADVTTNMTGGTVTVNVLGF